MVHRAKQNAKKDVRPFTSTKSERLIELATEINRLAAEFAHPDKKKPRVYSRP